MFKLKKVFIKISRFYQNNLKNLLKIAEKAIFFDKIVRFLRFTKKLNGSLIFTEKKKVIKISRFYQNNLKNLLHYFKYFKK